MNAIHEEVVSCLEELPVFKVIQKYTPGHLRAMTKQQLVDILPTKAVVSWSKPDILREVDRVYNSVNDYFDKHGFELSRLKAGQLCLRSGTLDKVTEGQTVYIFGGLTWSPFYDYVTCLLVEFNVILFSPSLREELHLRTSSRCCPHSRDHQLVYPLPASQSKMWYSALETLKLGLNNITPLHD